MSGLEYLDPSGPSRNRIRAASHFVEQISQGTTKPLIEESCRVPTKPIGYWSVTIFYWLFEEKKRSTLIVNRRSPIDNSKCFSSLLRLNACSYTDQSLLQSHIGFLGRFARQKIRQVEASLLFENGQAQHGTGMESA